MAIVVPDVGERYLLDRALKGTNNGNNLSLKLYSAVSGGLVEGTVAGDFTEATFAGYAAKALAPATWGAAATASGTSSSTYGALQTFTRTSTGANEAILGYYLVDATTGVLTWGEAFAATRNMVNINDSIAFTPYFEQA